MSTVDILQSLAILALAITSILHTYQLRNRQ
jgi:hypothetical protein